MDGSATLLLHGFSFPSVQSVGFCPLRKDMKSKMANGLVQLIAGRHHFRATATVVRRSGTGPACRRAGPVPSLPIPAIHAPRQPAIPDEGRSVKI